MNDNDDVYRVENSVFKTQRKRVVIKILQLNIYHLPHNTNTNCYSAVSHVLREFQGDQRVSCKIRVHFLLLPLRLKHVDLILHCKFLDIAFDRLFLEHFLSILFVPDTVP